MKVKVEMPLNMEAIRQIDQVIANHRAVLPADSDLRKCYAADRKDLRRVQTLYKKGKWAEALLYAQHMDTLPRDMIPDAIWNDINSIDCD